MYFPFFLTPSITSSLLHHPLLTPSLLQVSENFYFDMNTEGVKRMLGGHLGPADVSTQVSRP